jgi:hypothetical protein
MSYRLKKKQKQESRRMQRDARIMQIETEYCIERQIRGHNILLSAESSQE